MENLELLFEQANNGDAVSQYKLGRAYERGNGVEKNIVTAKMWYQKSADNGYKNAEVKLRLLPVQQEATIIVNMVTSEPPRQAYQAPPTPRLVALAHTQPNNNNVDNAQKAKKVSPIQNTTEQKSKVIAALLAFFLGSFGAHDFYLGYNKQGIIKIILTITIMCAGISYFWSLIDFIKIICNGKFDSNGQLLK